MLQLHEFSDNQQINLDESCSQQLSGLTSLEDTIKTQNKNTHTHLQGLVKFLSKSLQDVIGRINTFQTGQEQKITSCSVKIDEICQHFKELQSVQSRQLEELQESINREGARFEKLIDSHKNTLLMHLNKQREFEKEETKAVCSSIDAELDEMKKRISELLKSSCGKRGDVLFGRGALLEENFEEEKVKHREMVAESIQQLEKVKESSSASVEKLTIGEDIKRLLGDEFRDLNGVYCAEVNEKMNSLETELKEKVGAVGDDVTNGVSGLLDELVEQQNVLEDTSNRFNEDYKSFLANNAVVAEDLDTRISDICEQFITETGDRFLQEFTMMETNQQEVITSISDLNSDCISALEKLEMSQDVTTGTTPVKREIMYKKNLTRPRPQFLVLDSEQEVNEDVYDQKRKCSSPTFQSPPSS